MSGAITDDGAALFLEAMLGTTPITSMWVALLTDQPGIAMDGTILAAIEPQDSAYHRVSYAWDGTHWGQAGHFITNLDQVVFPTPTVDWGSINHYALCTEETGGLIYGFGELNNPTQVQAGWSTILPVGGMILSLSRQDVSIQV